MSIEDDIRRVRENAALLNAFVIVNGSIIVLGVTAFLLAICFGWLP